MKNTHVFSRSLNMLAGWALSALLAGAADQSAAVAGLMRDVTELGDLLQKKHAFFDPASVNSNITAAIVKAIDPYSEVLNKEQADLRREELRGVFYGIGITLTIKNKLPAITGIIQNSPAEAEGLKPGNLIEKIDDRKTEGTPLTEVISKLRGARDEVVCLTVRGGEKNAETNEYKLKRSLVQMPVTGLTEQWPFQMYYLKINGLYEKSGNQVVTQLVAWASAKCQGLILDLREADGGDLQSAAEVAALFQTSGTALLNVRDGNGAVIKSYQGTAEKTIDAPIMVLINHKTSAATEALAAALGTCKGALLIGMPTSGDDAVRDFLPLADGRIIYLATGRIEIKNGAPYHAAGVTPHVTVTQANDLSKFEETAPEEENGLPLNLSEQEKLNRALLRRTKNDPVLQRATDILLGLKALSIKGR